MAPQTSPWANCVSPESEFSVVPLQRKQLRFAISVPSRGLALTFVRLPPPSFLYLCAREGVAHVGERVEVGFSKRCQVPSSALLCEHCSFSPSSAKGAVPVSLTIAAKRLFRQGHRTWMIRVPSIPFCPLRLSIKVPFEQCVLRGAWSARCACTRTEINSCFALVCFFTVFVISSTPMPSRRLGPTDRYDGGAPMRKSSASALHRGAALRLFPFASSYAVLKRIVFALVTVFMSNGSRGGKSAWNSRSVSPMSTT